MGVLKELAAIPFLLIAWTLCALGESFTSLGLMILGKEREDIDE
jgi:hypothetical protein